MGSRNFNLTSLGFAQLLRFLELSRELHFTKAAEKLGIAQPLLSEQIKALEHLIDVKLFHRTSRKVSLTPAGEVFRDRVQLIVEGIRDGVGAARDAQSGERNCLRLGYTDEYSSDILPAALIALQKAEPTAQFELTFAMTPHLTKLLQTGLIDAAFVCPIPEEPLGSGYQAYPLRPLPLSVALPSDHRLSGKKSLSLAQLKDEPFIEGPASPLSASERVVNRLFANSGLHRDVVQRVGDLELCLSLVGGKVGHMIAYFPPHFINRTDVAIVPLSEKHANLTRALLWSVGSQVPLLDELLDQLDGESG